MIRLAAASLLVLAAGASAQKPVLEPSAALACLTPPEAERGAPEYPFDLYKLGRGGRVKVAVDFPGGLLGPAVDVLEREGEDSLVAAVRSHVRKLRVPCLERGEQARLVFEYAFRPTSEAPAEVGPYDTAEAARQKMLGCITSVSGETLPDYPEQLRRAMLQGRLLAWLRFDAADKPPAWELHHRVAAARLAPTLERWLGSLRMPCHEGGPVRLTQLYTFVMEGEGFGFKPLKLAQLMGSVRNIHQQRLQFDTTQMGCPFDLKFTYFQPFRLNRVASVGSADARRQPLFEWLAGSHLDLPRRSLDAIFGDTADVHVPCLKIDLDPSKELSK